MKNDEIKRLLREELQDELTNLNKMKLGDDEYKATVAGIGQLVDRLSELEKIDIDREDKVENRYMENNFRRQQMREDRVDRIIKNILTGLGIGLPIVVSIWGTLVSINFEREGTITTIMGRSWIQKLIPKK